MSDKDELIERATLAGHAERYDEMAAAMKNVVESGFELSSEDRNVFSVAYNNVVAGHRLSLRILSTIETEDCGKQQANDKDFIEIELRNVCNEVICLLNRLLITKTTNPRSMVFFLKMKCDFSQYLADVAVDKDNESYLEAVENSVKAYQEALVIANDKLRPTHPVRLSLANVLFYQIEKKQPKQASKPTKNVGMNDLPDSMMLSIFSYVSLRDQIKLESVSTRWNSVLNDKSLRKTGKVNLALLVNGDISKLPRAVHSLLVNKHEIINSITYVTKNRIEGADIDTLNAVMSTFSTIRPEQLISLKLGDDLIFKQSQADEFSQFLNCFVNLEVLALSVRRKRHEPPAKIDLYRLMKLKELKGVDVQFVNCRAQNLVKMDLCNVNLPSTNDCIDFVQMMSSVAENIEVLHLVNIQLWNYRPPSDRQMDIKFPKLSDFNMYDCLLNGITVNLVESRSLKRLGLWRNTNCVITNFNLSIHCLEYFYIDLLFSNSNIFSQFVASARADPQRLCLLEYLESTDCSVSIVEVLDCFNPCYTYSLREFICNELFTDCSGIIALIEHSTLLNRVCIGVDTNQKVLIDLIIGTIPLDIHVNGLRIEPRYYRLCRVDHNFFSKLYNALCSIDKKTMKCQNKVFVKVSDCGNDLIGKIKDEFNIIFFSTEDQFKLRI